ncbi:50S ribosomal protein L4 [Candidatus Daviesbacteria bacterium]|nr:50S ribosomal protein L4 [Candidatus Daviesbacteria bacterium]
MPAKKAQAKTVRRASGLSVPVYSLAGRAAGTMSLPKEIFGQKVNKNLLAQAVRVYLTNQKVMTASTKTRGEIRGSTRKVRPQKGTGRARHGARTAPIFVGGGVTFGPKPRRVRLALPQKMKQAALLSALSSKLADKEILGVAGLEKATGKTKEIAKLMKKITDKKSALIVTGEVQDNVVRGSRNIPGVSVLPANMLNAYEILRHRILLLTKEAVEKIGARL